MSAPIVAILDALPAVSSKSAARTGGLIPGLPSSGDASIADDQAFLDTMLLPPSPETPHGVFVRDPVWQWPESYAPQKNPCDRRLRHNLRFADGSTLRDQQHRPLLMARLRLVYAMLIDPKDQKPIDIGTIINYLRAIDYWSQWVVERAYGLGVRAFADMTYALIAEMNAAASKSLKRHIEDVFPRLRWHQAHDHLHGAWFHVPPFDATNENDSDPDIFVEDDEDAPQGVEVDAPKWVPNQVYQPFPDEFVAALGKVALFLVERVGPHAIKLMMRVERQRRSYKARYKPRKAGLHKEKWELSDAQTQAVRQTMADYPWPDDLKILPFPTPYAFPPRTIDDLKFLVSDLQTAALQLVALVTGVRTEEMIAMPRDCLRRLFDEKGRAYFVIRARTFKTEVNIRGIERDWPVCDEIVNALRLQQRLGWLLGNSAHRKLWLNKGTGAALQGAPQMLRQWADTHGFADKLEPGGRVHIHRFRKTIVRLVALTVMGAPKALQELLGHHSIMMTMRYILSSPFIRQQMLAIAEKERQRQLAKAVEEAPTAGGGGADYLRQSVERALRDIEIALPKTAHTQGQATEDAFLRRKAQDLLSVGPEGGGIKMILPGIFCVKPVGEAGNCCRKDEMPNAAKCEPTCGWHVQEAIRKPIIKRNIAHQIERIEAEAKNLMRLDFWQRALLTEIVIFPDIAAEFDSHPAVVEARRAVAARKTNGAL